jgi:hypothetical protein
MKNRDDMSAVIEGLLKDHRLLAAFLEATDKIDWRPLHRRVAIGETPKPVNLETHEAPTPPLLPQVEPLKSPVSPFAFRRANLVRASAFTISVEASASSSAAEGKSDPAIEATASRDDS